MAGRHGRVTAADVAREAGVSPTTVSYVLNNVPHQKIPDETRQRIHAAVARLGYKPSAAARALRRGRSDIVLLVIPDVPIGAAVAQIVENLTEELEPRGLTLISRSERHTPLSVLWQELMPAAVVALIELNPDDRTAMRAAGIHVFGALLRPSSDEDTTLSVPQHLIGRLQVEHLAATGHRHIGYAGPGDPRVQAFYDLRLDGARTACVDLGLDLPIVHEVPLDVAAAAAAVRRWRDADPRVTGVCAYNDETAFALLAGAREVGLAVPADLAVIGVDNIPLAPFTHPPLTTIDQNVAMFTGHLAEMIVSGIAGKHPPRAPRSESIALVIRQSA
ncbi:LacI family DNA-binding transcriptional regulator [Phytohabitans rumicis]|uniref:LacI family DNA-binding transcriptional regulator n=1 Tax=Phytohabitans rumicis TaxID=1076125 RepID=UPI0031F03273